MSLELFEQNMVGIRQLPEVSCYVIEVSEFEHVDWARGRPIFHIFVPFTFMLFLQEVKSH